MSRYDIKYLNENTLIGRTDERGNAWHNRFDLTMADGLTNHYPGFIPVEDVISRLLSFDVVKVPVSITIPEIITAEGVTPARTEVVPDRFAWARDDNWKVMGIHGDGYVGHGYKKWLIDNVLKMVGDDAGIANVVLLAHGAQCAVQIELPKNIDAGNGVSVSPFILATTSFDGSIATTYKRGFTNVVCDNTMSMFLAESGETYKRRHTRNSEFSILDAAGALNTLHLIGDQVTAEINRLLTIDVSDKHWGQFIEAHYPITDEIRAKGGRALTIRENMRTAVTGLYRTDVRVQPWAGTAWGVVQAVNTFNEHLATVKGADRYERKFTRAIAGKTTADDTATLTTLGNVLGIEDLINA